MNCQRCGKPITEYTPEDRKRFLEAAKAQSGTHAPKNKNRISPNSVSLAGEFAAIATP